MKKLIALALIVALFVIYTFAFNMKASLMINGEYRVFDETGFVDANMLSDTEKVIASNENFELVFDETTSYFSVVDLSSGAIYRSNPNVEDAWIDQGKPITDTAIEKQKSTLEIQYYNSKGSLTSINNYRLSIAHPESILNEEGERTFNVKYIDQGVQVQYLVEDIEVDYLFFPKYLPKDQMEAMDDFTLLNRIAYTGYDEERELYEIVQYEGMSNLVKKRLYAIFYDELGYTRDQAIEENLSYGYDESFMKVSFEVAVEIKLTDTGVETTLLRDSIVESEDTQISKITLYPLFGTADSSEDGYIVLPDGSGAVIDFNNGKESQNAYNKRLYGQDLAQLPYDMAETQQVITLPVYGMVKSYGGFAAIISKGDTMAWITADVSERIDSYNKVYTSFQLREVESVVIGSGFNTYGVDLWTKDIVATDFQVTYRFLSGDDNSYTGIAKAYQSHLIEAAMLFDHDDTTSTVLTTEFIGAYDEKAFFLGVPYYTNGSMTTFDEAQLIIEQLQDRNVNHMNVVYQGAINGGLSQDLNNKVDFENVLGGKKDYESLEAYLLDSDIDLYPAINLMTAYEYNKAFDQFRYTARRISGSQALMYQYHYPSGLPYSETPYEYSRDAFVISPLYYEAIYDKMNSDYLFENLSFQLMGSMITGNYSDSALVYKQESIEFQKALLGQVEQQMMFNNPLYFAYQYASYITDLPVEATLYSIIDDQIPLVQLILSGYVDYSSYSINLANDRSVEYQFLKHIETGSNLKYTLSYDDSRELLNTAYNYYMSTFYENWIDVIDDQVSELDGLGIHQGYLVNHERMANNVYQVTYSTGLKLLINYNLTAKVVGTTNVPAMDYVVVEGGIL